MYMNATDLYVIVFSVDLVCKEELNLMLDNDLFNYSRCNWFELVGTDSLFTLIHATIICVYHMS